MALAGRANAWWWDVLENGPSSPYAAYFDIDWDPPQRKLTATVLVPVLGDHYGRELELGHLKVERQRDSFVVRYQDLEMPVSPRTLDDLLARAAERAGSEELRRLAAAFGQLPHALRTDPASVAERHRAKETLRAQLAELLASRPEVTASIDAEIETVNRDPDALDRLLRRQNYRLAYWRTASEELSYRRFFNIETLAALQMERPEVFADTHRLVLDLVAQGAVDGLRVDHIDGLGYPENYLRRLQDATGGVYVVVEKILEADERLPETWPVAGTTGYDFLNRVNQLFVDSDHEAAMRASYARFTGEEQSFAQVVYAAKRQIMREDLAAEVERLTSLLAEICEEHRRQQDHTRRELRDALREVIAALPVYRIYPAPGLPVRPEDRAYVAAAVAAAQERRPELDAELIRFLGELLVLDHPGETETSFAVRFGQVSSPVMAKGVEDTAFYRYHPLVSLNEVGGDPGRFGAPPEEFHRTMDAAASRWPDAMLTLSTHDTKRTADVRARINLLSELPESWERAVYRWAEHNARHKDGDWPDRNAEHLLYQTLVGTWPIETERVSAFMAKATKEAKVHTSWTDPHPEYDEALRHFVSAALGDRAFVADIKEFLSEHRLVERAHVNSLAQTTLLLTCPGIPDLYQGTEVWDLSLVDPDNRRPVDYDHRRQLLGSLAEAGPEAALARPDDGGPKLWLIHRLLMYRRRRPSLFGRGSAYQAIPAAGSKAKHAVAFTRTGGLVVVVPRLVIGLRDDWADTTVALPEGRWVNVLTEDEVIGGLARVDDLCRRFPVAVLARPL
jgi:(1->4)-alpha-D-glucan 1-alpha-D-glucosylmutase